MNEKRQASEPAGADRIETIDAAWLRDALVAGIHRVIEQRDFINRINVFPVADADTGTNLAFTLHAVAVGMRDRHHDSISEFSRWIADLALDGARGNSGAIFAQYLQGFSEATGEAVTLTPASYAEATLAGARSAYGAIADPRAGTMVSVIHDYALELRTQVADGVDEFATLLARGLKRASESLADTPNQLEVLRQNNVVDAGAQGFVALLEGMQELIETGSLRELIPGGVEFVADEDAPDPLSNEESEHRYCTECVISGEQIDRHRLREQVLGLGASSLVIAGTKRKVRVHAHLDNPGQLFLLCEEFGEVTSQKADDMHKQQASAHRSRQKVAVVVDTGADIPEEVLERLQINVVPLRITLGDRQYLDKVSVTPAELYQLFRDASALPQTSQPPPGDFRRQFEFLASHFEQGVVCVSISSALSGTWQAAESAARRVEGDRVTVFDTLDASAGQGLIAMVAAEVAQTGAGRDRVLAAVADATARTRTMAVIPDMSHAVRGGRLPAWVRSIADLLRLTPVIATTAQGEIRPGGVIFGRKELPRRFARWIARQLGDEDGYRILIAHCDNGSGARLLRDQLVRTLPRVQTVFLTEAGAALGAHAGPGTLIVGVQKYRPIEELLDTN